MSFPAYPEYKDSGVFWLGKIPKEWDILPFKWLINRNDGGVWGEDPTGVNDTIVLRSTEQSVDGHWEIHDPAYRALSDEEKQSSTLRLNDLLITKSSGSALHIGKTTLVTKSIADLNCCYSNFTQRIRVGDGIHPKVAWYILNNSVARIQFDLLSNSTTGLANLNGSMIGKTLIPLIPMHEQLQILNFLDHETAKIDSLIAEQEKLIELLKEKRQAVISHAVTKGLDPNVKMKDSGVEWLGEVPEHWDVKKLKHVAIATNGLTYSPENIVDESEGVLVLRSSNIQNGQISLEDNVYVNMQIPKKSVVNCGDILICSRNGSRALIGKNALIPNELNGVAYGAFMMLLRSPISQHIYWILNSFIFEFQSSIFLTSTINQLTVADLYSFEVPIPPVEEQHQINIHLSKTQADLRLLISNSESIIKLLNERRSALISAAVTGQIDVRNAVTHPEAA